MDVHDPALLMIPIGDLQEHQHQLLHGHGLSQQDSFAYEGVAGDTKRVYSCAGPAPMEGEMLVSKWGMPGVDRA